MITGGFLGFLVLVLVFASIPTPVPIPAQPEPPVTGDRRFTNMERSLSLAQVKMWQAALCAEVVDGNLGEHDSKTRKAIRDYLISQGARDKSDESYHPPHSK